MSPGGSGYFTCIRNMKLVTNKFKLGGPHEKHVVATWNLGKHLSICLQTQGNQEKPVSRWPVAGHGRSRSASRDLYPFTKNVKYVRFPTSQKLNEKSLQLYPKEVYVCNYGDALVQSRTSTPPFSKPLRHFLTCNSLITSLPRTSFTWR